MWIKYTCTLATIEVGIFPLISTILKIFTGYIQNQYLVVLPTFGVICFGELHTETFGGRRNRCPEQFHGSDQ